MAAAFRNFKRWGFGGRLGSAFLAHGFYFFLRKCQCRDGCVFQSPGAATPVVPSRRSKCNRDPRCRLARTQRYHRPPILTKYLVFAIS
jgi:hypothetical protein